MKTSAVATVGITISNEFNAALKAGQTALDADNIPEAEKQLKNARELRPDDLEAKKLGTSIEVAKDLRDKDLRLQEMFVWFNVLKVSELPKTSEARKEERLGSISKADKANYMKRALWFEVNCPSGWLDQNGRRQHLQKLKKRIEDW